MKLGSFFAQESLTRSSRWGSLLLVGLTLAVSQLAGCASAPSQPVREQLDPQTATTLTVIDHPIELVAEASYGPARDPFAYIAPFETDRMGEHHMFLWVATPGSGGAGIQPQVLCDSHPVALEPVEADLPQMGLSQPPYTPPAPWSGQYYFRLTPEALQCLAAAQAVSLETTAPQGGPIRFTAERKSLTSLEAFSHP